MFRFWLEFFEVRSTKFYPEGNFSSQLCFYFQSQLSALDGNSASFISYTRCLLCARDCAHVASAVAGHLFHSFQCLRSDTS